MGRARSTELGSILFLLCCVFGGGGMGMAALHCTRMLPSMLAGYGAWLHGEAVAAGTMMAADMSLRLGWIDAGLVQRIRALNERANLPVAPPPVGAPQAVRVIWQPRVEPRCRAFSCLTSAVPHCRCRP